MQEEEKVMSRVVACLFDRVGIGVGVYFPILFFSFHFSFFIMGWNLREIKRKMKMLKK